MVASGQFVAGPAMTWLPMAFNGTVDWTYQGLKVLVTRMG